MEVKSAVNDLINRTLANLQMVGNVIGTWPFSDEKLHIYSFYFALQSSMCHNVFCIIDTCWALGFSKTLLP